MKAQEIVAGLCCLFILLFVLLGVALEAFAMEVNLAWDAPTTNTDGTPLVDLDGYKIYCSQTAGDYTTPFCEVDVGNVVTATIDVQTDGGTFYFVATAYDTTEHESEPSNEVTHTFPFLCPAAPEALRVVP